MAYNLSPCKTDGLRAYGLACLDNGLEPIPVPFKKKAPALKGWQNMPITQSLMKKWVSEPSRSKDGIGLRTGQLAAIDLDIYDEELRDKAVDLFLSMTGLTMSDLVIRVGQWPKCLFVMQSGAAYRKKSTAVWEDWQDNAHKVEILGKGQHFMAAGTHPDTNEPFQWSSDLSTLNIDDLPVFTEAEAEAFVAAVENLFESEGLEVKRNRSNVTTLTTRRNEKTVLLDDDDFEDSNSPIKTTFTKEDIQEALDMIQGRVDENYDFWLEIGMILHRACTLHSGVLSEVDAFAMWDEWSMASGNYNAEEVTAKWSSFDSKRGDAIGPASLFMYAKEARAEQRKQYSDDMADRIANAGDIETLTGPVMDAAKKFATEHKLNIASRDLLASAISERARELGRNLSKTVVAKAITPTRRFSPITLPEERKLERTEIDSLQGFEWCQEWIYVSAMECFYNTKNHDLLSTRAFDTVYAWNFTPIGEVHAMIAPARFMSNVYNIDVVNSVLAMPDRPAGFSQFDGKSVWNIHHAPSLSAMGSKDWNDYQSKYVEYFKRHLLLCCGGDQREADIFTAWLAYALIYPERRLQWFTLLCGIEGTGKSLIFSIAEHQLGERFVNKVGSEELTGSRFNSWADGKYFLCLEEMKVSGHSRLAVQNKLKDYSNDKIPIEHKGKGTYKAPNYAKIFALSNHFDTISVNKTDRRWFIGHSEIEDEAQLDAFLKATPDHFTFLYDGVKKIEHVSEAMAAVRGFLKSVADNPCDEFKEAVRTQRAPVTRAKASMIEQEELPAVDELNAVMDDPDYPFINHDMVSVSEFMSLIEQGLFKSIKVRKDDSKERDYLIRTAIPKLLKEPPFNLTGNTRRRVGVKSRHRLHYRKPSKQSGVTEAQAVTTYLKTAVDSGVSPLCDTDEDFEG